MTFSCLEIYFCYVKLILVLQTGEEKLKEKAKVILKRFKMF